MTHVHVYVIEIVFKHYFFPRLLSNLVLKSQVYFIVKWDMTHVHVHVIEIVFKNTISFLIIMQSGPKVPSLLYIHIQDNIFE